MRSRHTVWVGVPRQWSSCVKSPTIRPLDKQGGRRRTQPSIMMSDPLLTASNNVIKINEAKWRRQCGRKNTHKKIWEISSIRRRKRKTKMKCALKSELLGRILQAFVKLVWHLFYMQQEYQSQCCTFIQEEIISWILDTAISQAMNLSVPVERGFMWKII